MSANDLSSAEAVYDENRYVGTVHMSIRYPRLAAWHAIYHNLLGLKEHYLLSTKEEAIQTLKDLSQAERSQRL